MTAFILPCWSWIAGIGLYVAVCRTYQTRAPKNVAQPQRGPSCGAERHDRAQAIHDWQMQQGWKP